MVVVAAAVGEGFEGRAGNGKRPQVGGVSCDLGGGRIKASRRVLQRRLILRSGNPPGGPAKHLPATPTTEGWGGRLLKKKK